MDSWNFISYNYLNDEDRLLFFHCGLNRFVAKAGSILADRIGHVETRDHGIEFFTREGLERLEGLVEEVLILIGRNSNLRYGHEPRDQNLFFRKLSERNSFPTHLGLSRVQEAIKQLQKRNKKHLKRIDENAKKINPDLFSKESFKGISSLKKVRYGDSELNESETRAVGVLYMVGLVWQTVKDYQVDQHNQDKFSLGLIKQLSFPFLMESCFELALMFDESGLIQKRLKGGCKGKREERFLDSRKIIFEIVKNAPGIQTNILLKRAQKEISANCLSEDIPSERWIRDQIHNYQKSLRGN